MSEKPMAELTQRTNPENPARECWSVDVSGGVDGHMPELRRHATSRSATVRGLAGLSALIEGAVVPSLVAAHRGGLDAKGLPVAQASLPNAQDVNDFTALVLGTDERLAIAYIAAWQERGLAMESTFLDLLAPSARLLGQFWNDDVYSFADVTLGVARLTRMLRDLAPTFAQEAQAEPNGMHALMVPVIGTQHTFGLMMVSEFMRRAGWTVVSGAVASDHEMAVAVRDKWFNIIGFSASCDAQIKPLAAAIRMVRRESANRAVGVMVGGPLLLAHPDLAVLVGADKGAMDARQAVLEAADLASVKSRRV